jgi:plasmid maintenance system antidote protein VapI
MTSDDARPPSEHLAEHLEARDWDGVDLAYHSGLPLDMIRRLLTGDQYITEVTSMRLSQALDTPPGFWIDRQSRYLYELTRDVPT